MSAYNDRDIYIAFKYKGVGTSGRMWYIDNVQVYVGEIFTKDITAYTEGSNDRYYLIASPVGEVNPENVANMLANNYDLYYFNQSKELEWINYEGTDGNFSLIPGKGYLYANSGNVTLRFVGQPYNGDGQISLDKVSGAEFEGWNLIGNPFSTPALLDKPYYRLNQDGSALKCSADTNIPTNYQLVKLGTDTTDDALRIYNIRHYGIPLTSTLEFISSSDIKYSDEWSFTLQAKNSNQNFIIPTGSTFSVDILCDSTQELAFCTLSGPQLTLSSIPLVSTNLKNGLSLLI